MNPEDIPALSFRYGARGIRENQDREHKTENGAVWLKADLHLHTCEGPETIVQWTPRELIDLAAQAGYQVLSFTDHERQTYDLSLARYAQDRGIVLIPGVEATVEGHHVLLYNFSCSPKDLRTFRDIRRCKEPTSLVVAPHPFFPGSTSLRWRLLEQLDVFDAVEYSHFYTTWIDYNRRMLPLARGYDLPLLGSSDAHLPCQLGTTYSLIQAEPRPEAVIDAVRAGRVRVVSRPLTTYMLCSIALVLLGGMALRTRSWPRLIRALREGLGVTAVGVSPERTVSSEPNGYEVVTAVEGNRRQGSFLLPPEQSHAKGQD